MEENEILKKVLKLIIDESNKKGNEWLKIAIDGVNNKAEDNRMVSSSVSELSLDLRRTKFYLQKIDRKLHIDAFNIYKNISCEELKVKLIKDHKEMHIFLRDFELLEYGRKMTNQIETCLDSAILDLDAWSKIQSDLKFRKPIVVKWLTFEKIYDLERDFFWFDKATNSYRSKELSNVELKSKLIFCCEYYNIKYIKYWTNIDEIFFLRNKASHGLLNNKEKIRLEKIRNKFTTSHYFYVRFFNELISSLKVLYKMPEEEV